MGGLAFWSLSMRMIAGDILQGMRNFVRHRGWPKAWKSATLALISLSAPLALQGANQAEIVAEHVGQKIGPQQIVVTLERTACLGSCPVYRITITGTGEVEYEGKDLVKVRGIRKGTVHRDAVLKIVNELLRVRIFDAASEYVVRDAITGHDDKLTLSSIVSTDGASALLQLRIGKHEKRVRLYANYPQELGAIPDLIDQTVRIEQWIGSFCERPRSPFGPRLQPGECGR
jgi:hypothetical protein